MRTLLSLTILALSSVSATWSNAQEAYPSRPITIVVPYAAGGTSDGQARMFQDALGKELGQPIVVDNKPGASGAIAAQFVARSKGDGYTLLYPNNGVLTSPLLNDKSVPATDTKSFLDYVRKQPNGVMYASAGTASYGHLSSARLAQLAGMK